MAAYLLQQQSRSTQELPLAARPLESGDAEYVLRSWMDSYLESPCNKGTKHGLYFRNQAELIRSILGNPATTALAAEVKGVPGEIAGWVVFERHDPVIVHWLFVRPIYRHFGIGRALLLLTGWNGGTIWASHQPRFIRNGLTLGLDIQYNPFLVVRPR